MLPYQDYFAHQVTYSKFLDNVWDSFFLPALLLIARAAVAQRFVVVYPFSMPLRLWARESFFITWLLGQRSQPEARQEPSWTPYPYAPKTANWQRLTLIAGLSCRSCLLSVPRTIDPEHAHLKYPDSSKSLTSPFCHLSVFSLFGAPQHRAVTRRRLCARGRALP